MQEFDVLNLLVFNSVTYIHVWEIIDCQVNYALGALYYLCNKSNREDILKPEVVDVIERYAAAQTISVSFSNLAKAFLDKHVTWGHVRYDSLFSY